MALLNVNPAAEVSASFESVKAGVYRVRVKEVVDRNPEKNDLKVSFEHLTPTSELVNPAGEALKGIPGALIDYVMLADDKQWKLRSLTEACGLAWQNYDPIVELPGCELDVTVKIEMYEGEPRNKVGRYVVPK